MRLIALAAFAGLHTTAAHADTMAHCAAAWKAKTPEATAAGSYKAWDKACLVKTYTVPASTAGASTVPPGATAVCKDLTYSMSKTASGRCSGHGGVARVL
jgi:invasion protein IalB